MISTPDVGALRDLSRRIEHLSLTDAMARKIRIIINRSTSSDAVSVEEVEKLVRFPVSIAIPNNYVELVRAINAGVPIPPGQRSGFSQQFAKWSSKLEVGILEPELGKETKGLLNFLRKKPGNAVPRSVPRSVHG
jgi:pilus assembly protein CpaE